MKIFQARSIVSRSSSRQRKAKHFRERGELETLGNDKFKSRALLSCKFYGYLNTRIVDEERITS